MTANDGQGGRTILGTGEHGAIQALSEQSAAPSAAEPAADPLIDRALAGRYHIERKLGEGGMGAVYIGRHMTLDKPVAIKVLHPEYARKPDLVERFLQEAKAASRIRHENVIDITDFGVSEDGMVFFCMEYLTGQDLHELVTRAKLEGRRIPWDRSAPIFLQICGALSAAHAAGVIHRDLKPENIFLIEWLGSPDFVKLLDFGIAKMTEVNEEGRKLTKTGMLFGTPEYMSPEQARGENPDHRVDVYAMGCILFQLITGDVPFAGESFMAVLAQHLTAAAPVVDADALVAVGAPVALSGVIAKALAKDRDQRYSSIAELADAVREVSGGDVVSASVEASRSRSGWRGSAVIPAARATDTVSVPAANVAPPSPRRGLVIGLALVAVLAIAGIAFALSRGGGDDNKAADSDPAGTPVGETTPTDTTAGGAATDPSMTSAGEKDGSGSREATSGSALEGRAGPAEGDVPDITGTDQAGSDQAARDQAARDQAATEAAAKEEAAAQAAKEAAAEQAKELAAREKAAREKAAREKAARDKKPGSDVTVGEVGTKSPFGEKKDPEKKPETK